MGIPMNSTCYMCILKKCYEFGRSHGDEATATAYFKDVMKTFLEMPEDMNSSSTAPLFAPLYEKHFGLTQDRCRQEKIDSNRFVL